MLIRTDFIFLTVDWAGAFFSLMALVAQHTFDVLGGSLYIVCLFLELGIFISQAVWLLRTRHVRREAKKAGKTYDQYVAEHPSRKPSSESLNSITDLEACHPDTPGSKTGLQQSKNEIAKEEHPMKAQEEMHPNDCHEKVAISD